MLNYPNGPTVVSWYQFDVTGGNFPATPVQQQDWSNGNDGLWRWMPSIAVDRKRQTRSLVIPLPARQSSLRFATPDVSPVTRQVTLRKEKASCGRESDPRLAARAGVIIPGQKSIPPTAWTSGISTNMPKMATGTRASASSTSGGAEPRRQLQGVHQHQGRAPLRLRGPSASCNRSKAGIANQFVNCRKARKLRARCLQRVDKRSSPPREGPAHRMPVRACARSRRERRADAGGARSSRCGWRDSAPFSPIWE